MGATIQLSGLLLLAILAWIAYRIYRKKASKSEALDGVAASALTENDTSKKLNKFKWALGVVGFLMVVSLLGENKESFAKKAGFSSVAAYEKAMEAGFETKAEYDAHLEQQRLQAQATERGFDTVAAMQDAEQRGFVSATQAQAAADAGVDTRAAYEDYLEQNRLEAQAAERGFDTVEAMRDAKRRGFTTAKEEKEAADAGFETKVEYSKYVERRNQPKFDFAPKFRKSADVMIEKWNLVERLAAVLRSDGEQFANCRAYQTAAFTSALATSDQNISQESFLWIVAGVIASDAIYAVEQDSDTLRGQHLSSFNRKNSLCSKDNNSVFACANVCRQKLIEASKQTPNF